jgi:hypothetical protein
VPPTYVLQVDGGEVCTSNNEAMSNIVCNLIFPDLINGFKGRALVVMHIIALTRSLTIRTKRRYREASDAATAIHIGVKRPRVVFRRGRGRDAPLKWYQSASRLQLHDTRRHCQQTVRPEKQLSHTSGQMACGWIA